MFKSAFLFIQICFISFSAIAQPNQHSRVKIWTSETGIRQLAAMGIETDHGDYRKNVWFISDFSESEIQKIAAAGFRHEILIADVSSHYRQQALTPSTSKLQSAVGCNSNAPVYAVPSNFSLGSYAGYFTYQEMLDNLDSMASKYPSLISIKQPLPGGTSLEGENIYYLKISDNPLVDESEPEMLYTAVHHAREPGSMSQMIFYMWYLLENYATDPQIAVIINNTELFFVPCLNPDGYLYNEFTDPNGGGLWRKNRRNNLDGTFGVDLNRNYGYNWGYDDFGSSPDGNDQTFRGNNAFSEPETQLIRDFVNSRNFLITLNYHTFGNLLIYPWGYDFSIYTPDSALYFNYGNLLTTHNGYNTGTADQTLNYIVNGSSDDWMYGEQTTKPKIFAFTPECGAGQFGFWPPASEIIPICQNTVFQNISAALLTGRYASIKETSPALIANGGGYVNFTMTQLGLDTTGTYTITLTGLTPNIVSTGTPVSHGNLNVLQMVDDSISYALTTPMTNGDEIKFLLSIDNGQYVRTDTILKHFGPANVVFASDCNSTSGWNIGQWGISTTEFYSPTGSITDSPVGDYDGNALSVCELANSVNLTTALKARLSFYAKWAIEADYDYVQVQASADGGSTWIALCGNYTVPGTMFQVSDEPVYEGNQLSWVKEEINLDDFVGSTINLRFFLASDGFQEYDGFYFDDVSITTVLPGTNSIEDAASEISISNVTPNPAGDYFYVTMSNPVYTGTLKIYDSLGKIVSHVDIIPGSTSVKIQIDNLRSGVYFVRLENKGASGTPVKLVVH
ncbi:MAG: immune inhibitor A [Bacteroidota bacterium]|nr:immune inhibitor A [Bacteroidota bacterium]